MHHSHLLRTGTFAEEGESSLVLSMDLTPSPLWVLSHLSVSLTPVQPLSWVSSAHSTDVKAKAQKGCDLPKATVLIVAELGFKIRLMVALQHYTLPRSSEGHHVKSYCIPHWWPRLGPQWISFPGVVGTPPGTTFAHLQLIFWTQHYCVSFSPPLFFLWFQASRVRWPPWSEGRSFKWNRKRNGIHRQPLATATCFFYAKDMNPNETQFSENPGVHKYGYGAEFLIKLNDSAVRHSFCVCGCHLREKSLGCQGKRRRNYLEMSRCQCK